MRSCDVSTSECSVIVPTFRRPKQLLLCLGGIAAQSRKPMQTIVVRRRTDLETEHALQGDLPVPVTEVIVDQGGVIAAMAQGVRMASGAVVAFVDDDAVPHPNWLATLLLLLKEADVGGAGGRDIVAGLTDEMTPDVGRISAFGKLIGNHHRGSPGVREVAVLKGVNCAYRREAIEFPTNLRGTGAQVAWEWAVAFRARSNGWRLLYDSNVKVDHYPGPRFDRDRRDEPNREAVADIVWNETFVIGSFDRRLLYRRLLFFTLVGTSTAPGVIRGAAALLRREERSRVLWRWWPSMRGLYSAGWAVHRGKRVSFTSNGPAS